MVHSFIHCWTLINFLTAGNWISKLVLKEKCTCVHYFNKDRTNRAHVTKDEVYSTWENVFLISRNENKSNILYVNQSSVSSGFIVRWMSSSGGVLWIIQAVKKCYCIVKETHIWHLYLHNKERQWLLTDKTSTFLWCNPHVLFIESLLWDLWFGQVLRVEPFSANSPWNICYCLCFNNNTISFKSLG